MNETKLERRMAELEQEMAALRAKVAELSGSKPWWERIAGTFHNDPVYRKAMKLGRQYRRSQAPNGPKPNGK